MSNRRLLRSTAGVNRLYANTVDPNSLHLDGDRMNTRGKSKTVSAMDDRAAPILNDNASKEDTQQESRISNASANSYATNEPGRGMRSSYNNTATIIQREPVRDFKPTENPFRLWRPEDFALYHPNKGAPTAKNGKNQTATELMVNIFSIKLSFFL